MTVMTSAMSVLYPARSGARALTSEDLWGLPRVGAPVLAPDASWLVTAVTTYDLEKNEGRSRIWRVSAKGGDALALTSEETSSSEPAISPDGTRLAFTRKTDSPNATGKRQVFVMPLAGGEARRLTDLPLGAFDPQWLPDGSGLVFAAQVLRGHFTPEATKAELERREKDPVKAHVTEERVYRFWDTWLTTGEVPHLWHLDLASGKLRDLTPESLAWFDWMEPSGQFDISPDGREVAFAGILIQVAVQVDGRDAADGQRSGELARSVFSAGEQQCPSAARGELAHDAGFRVAAHREDVVRHGCDR